MSSAANDAIATLAALLRPAGAGVHLVSTGRAEQEALSRRVYGVARTEELAAYLAEHPEAPVEIATVWWDVTR